MKKLLTLLIGLTALSNVYAVPFSSNQLATTSLTNGNILQTNGSWSTWVATSSIFPSLSGYVPYTGATSNVNLGNFNLFANNLIASSTSTTSAGATTTLTSSSARVQRLTGASSQTYILPDATTLTRGSWFNFDNNSSGSLIIVDAGLNVLYTAPGGGYVQANVTSVASANGGWDFHPLAPATVTWGSGTTGMVMNSVLSTSPSILAGASSCTSPSFIPQRGSATTGFGGNGTTICGTVGGATIFSASSSGFITTNGTSTIWATSEFRLSGIFRDSANSAGTVGSVLQTSGGGVVWAATNTLGFVPYQGANAQVNLGSQTLNTTGLITSSSSVFNTVGVATTSPATQLSVATGSVMVSEFLPNATSTAITFDWRNGNQALLRYGTANVVVTFTNNSPGMRFTLITCAPPSGTPGTIFFSTSTNNIYWTGGSLPASTATVKKCDVWSFISTQATSSNVIFGAVNSNF